MEAVALGVLQEEINQALRQSTDYHMCAVTLNAKGLVWDISNVRISTTDLPGVNLIMLEMAVNKCVQNMFGKRIIKASSEALT